jgi:hypothetical protein
MTDNRMGGLALILGSLAGIVTMVFHPTGHDFFAPGQFDSATRLGIAVHSLALASLPVSFLGALALSRRVWPRDRLAIAALVIFGFAVVAAMGAAVASGLVAPAVARQMVRAAQPEEAWRAVFHYTGHLNQGFVQVFVAASSVAIVLWSVSMVRSGAFARGVGYYGMVSGALILLALFSGRLRLNVHGFGLVFLVQAIWFISAGALLWRLKEE